MASQATIGNRKKARKRGNSLRCFSRPEIGKFHRDRQQKR